MMAEYNAKWSEADKAKVTRDPVEFTVPAGHNSHVMHFTNFFESIGIINRS